MSAQVRTIIGRTPAHVPIRPIVALVSAATAAAIAFSLIAMEQPARVEAPVAELDWAATTGHPAIQNRFGGGEAEVSEVPVQRLYPDGFGSRAEVSEVPVQRLYPDGFGSRAELSEVPVQRLYPDGFGSRADLSEVPVQRLYPDGFGEAGADI